MNKQTNHWSVAASVFSTAVLHLQGGIRYSLTAAWKANRIAQVANAIWAGAGPLNQTYSPTWITTQLVS